MEPDNELIANALNGSLHAWETLVRRYEGRVYNYSLRLTGNRDDALDLMQDVFLGVYRNLSRFRGESQFISWLFRIAHNKAVDLARRRHANPVKGQALPEDPDAWPESQSSGSQWPGSQTSDSGPQELAMAIESNVAIHRLLQALSPEQRLILELKVFQGMTFDEIAMMQEISANTAKTRFYAALKKLRALMEGHHELSPNR
ncbi:RNA polymerase sigma factor [Pseudohongiella sp.]|uniref:HTH luxR-type domain-containing protein n=1 Tax=marine sediment metagenome TaxID=412755 RepID=A0A0F9Z6H2_9ZZZZ|nr:sigma-70 family RNA polymerase sigma factor [Pseudohongiella sp.]HDZ09545.1 sigma-70 family RNA polymerase sigma factor [Pseudohongiella sp.]HEA62633.1 sigma-70 family RNA polymerase sigma factor [Pseudohongiella sp.]